MVPRSPNRRSRSALLGPWWYRVGLVAGLSAMLLLLALVAWTPQTTGHVALAADCAGQLGPMGDFNGFVFQDMPYKNGSVDGRLAVGGNATFDTGVGVDVGLTLTPNANRDDLIVGGDLTYQSGSMPSGGATYGGTVTIGKSVTVLGGFRNVPPSQARPPLDFAAAQTLAANLSATLAGYPDNGTYASTPSSLTITGTNPATNVITVPASVLASSFATSVNAPAGSTVIINVTGPQPALGFAVTLNGTDSSHVLWHFPQATSMTMKNIEMLGTVLAPAATVTFSNGGMSGQLIAQSLTTPNAVPFSVFAGDGQGNGGKLHNVPFIGCLTPPPLPTATATFTAVPNTADLSIGKDDGRTTAVPGETVAYQIVVRNKGPRTVVGATIADAVPAALTGVTWTCAGAGGAICHDASGSGNAISTLADLPLNGVATYVVTGTLDPAATGTLMNTATISPPAGISDPDPTNNTATDQDVITPVAALSITKVDGKTTAIPGTVIAYSIVARNNGPSAVTGAAITDTVPATLTGVTWTCAGLSGGVCGVPSGTGNAIATSATLPPNGAVNYIVHAILSPAATGQLVNTATVVPPAGVADPDVADNSATDVDDITPTADLSITKDDGQTTAIPGTDVTYQIVATNDGPSDVTNATIADTVPAALANVSWTCTGAGGGVCGASTGTGNAISTTATLPAGGSATYFVTGSLIPTATGTLTNTATITLPTGASDPIASNNASTDTDTITPTVDLRVAKSDGQSVAVPGAPITYLFVVGNLGPSTATNAAIKDTVPADIQNVTWTCVGIRGATCGAASGSGNDINTTATIGFDSAVRYTVTGTLSPTAASPLTNTVTANPPPGTTDTNPTNNSATDTDTVSASTTDLTIGKDDGVTTVSPGDTVVYAIVVRNNNPTNPIPSATVTDTMPAELSGVTWTCVGTNGATCGAASGTGDIGVTIALPAQSTVIFEVVATVAATSGSITNTATVTPTSGPAPPPATDTDTITPVADLVIRKTNTQTRITPRSTPGTTVTYLIGVGNHGPSDVTGATITDTVPATLTGVTWTCMSASGANASCATPSGTGNAIAVGASLTPGAAVILHVTGTLTAGASGTLTNTATVAPPVGTTDPDMSNNSATDSDPITPVADLAISKTNPQPIVVPGTTVTYLLTASNNGPSDVTNAMITNSVPAALTNVTWTCASASGANASCGIASGTGNTISIPVSLQAGSTVTVTVTGMLNPAATGTVTNTAQIAPPVGTTDPDMSNNTATRQIVVTPTADLSIEKTNAQSTQTAGTPIAYIIVVRNRGPSAVTGATVNDPAPAGLGNVQWTCTGLNGGVCGAPSGTGTIATTVNLPVNGAALFRLSGTLDPAATGALTNTAIITPPTGVTDPNLNNNQATDDDPVLPQEVIPTGVAITAAGGGPLVMKVGEVKQLTATLTFSNNTTQDVSTQAQWTTSASEIATVDATGKVLGWSPGTTTITATVNGVQGTTTLTVIPGIPVGVAPVPAPAGRSSGASGGSATAVPPAPPSRSGGSTGSPTPQPLPPSRP